MAKPLVLFGAGEIAELAHFYFTTDSAREPVCFVVDDAYLKDESFCGLPVLPYSQLLERYPPSDYDAFVALSYSGMNRLRADKYRLLKADGYQLASYLSSHCTYLSQYPAGDNCFILEDNTIQPFVKIGSNVTLWSGNHIGHGSTVEDHVFISSHVVISGNCVISERCFLGVNSTLRNGITLAPETLLGAGAAIMADSEEKGVYLPARCVKLSRSSDEVEL